VEKEERQRYKEKNKLSDLFTNLMILKKPRQVLKIPEKLRSKGIDSENPSKTVGKRRKASIEGWRECRRASIASESVLGNRGVLPDQLGD
jgi:hypothetical protein